ncbi:hypothetical protein CVT26_008454 [Gymnopilus dilepis]|uniref:Uncharacterized protein n=1 Tax=Gymnopilus dilepis TaxID=231916 RepID=A0A409XXD2_9AGAR|nr:hypothetical protein CVT26_008454 [Gymnopilus dilepis]
MSNVWDARLGRIRQGLIGYLSARRVLPADYAVVPEGYYVAVPPRGEIGAFWPLDNLRVFADNAIKNTADRRAYFNWTPALYHKFCSLPKDAQYQLYGIFEALARTLYFQHQRARRQQVSTADMQELETWVNAMGVNGP